MKTRMILERPKDRYSKPYDKYDYVAMTIVTIGAMIIALLCGTCSPCHAEPDYQALSVAIRQAEGNANFGILTHYKHTSYEQACKNTCQHAYKDWVKTLPRSEKGHKMARREAYLKFLANRYAPRHVLNDPKDLNKNWFKNVNKLYKGDV